MAENNISKYGPPKEPEYIETIRVRNKSGKEILIDPDDYDKTRYERVTEQAKDETSAVEKKPTPIVEKFGNQPKEELLTWIRTELRKLPEYKYVKNPPRDKNGIVDAIMYVRDMNECGKLELLQ